MGKCGGGMRAKEIAYANLQKLYSKVVAFCIYPIHIKYEYYLSFLYKGTRNE